jgi:hypothetical protein
MSCFIYNIYNYYNIHKFKNRNYIIIYIKMVRKVRTVSLTPEQDKFILENNINASAIIQREIEKQMTDKVNPEILQALREEIINLNKAVENWNFLAYQFRDFILSKNLMDEFLVWRDKK